MRIYSLLTLLLISFTGLFAQSIEELKEMKAEKQAYIDDLQAQIDAAQSEIDGINNELDILSGWNKGFTGLVGFGLNNSNGWVANPNPDAKSSALNIGVTAFANKLGEKSFWNNKAVITKSWQDVDLSEGDANAEDDGLFDNGTVDIFNIQSLYGYKLSDQLAISAMADMNTSVENFLNPGVLDLGLGATWVPSSNMTVVVHPFNYHLAFSGVEGVETVGAFGAKVRADLNQPISLGNNTITWTTTLMSFIPYESNDPTMFEFTWLNTINFELWKGIGVGIGFGIRNAEFESADTQSYTSLGLSYGF